MDEQLVRSFPVWVREELREDPYIGRGSHFQDLLRKPGVDLLWERFGRLEVLPDQDFLPRRPSRLSAISDALRFGLAPLPWYDMLTGTERKGLAHRIGWLCTELANEEAWLVGNDESIYPNGPGTTHGTYSYFTLDTASDFVEKDLISGGSDRSKFFQSLSDEGRGEVFDVVRHAMWFAIKRLPELLDAIGEASDIWGELAPKLYRPNDPNAQRLIFLRAATHVFMKYFGRPLREETILLASFSFEVSDLDSALLSRLAPVSKEVKRASRAGARKERKA